MGKASQRRKNKIPPSLDEQLRQQHRQMGQVALQIYQQQHGGSSDTLAALGSLFAEYSSMANAQNAQVLAMSCAADWIMRLTGLNFEQVTAEIVRASEEKAARLQAQQPKGYVQ